jgi:hypothetical protein
LGIILRTFLKATNSIARIVQKVNWVDGALPHIQLQLAAVKAVQADLMEFAALAGGEGTAMIVVKQASPTANYVPFAVTTIHASSVMYILATGSKVIVEFVMVGDAEVLDYVQTEFRSTKELTGPKGVMPLAQPVVWWNYHSRSAKTASIVRFCHLLLRSSSTNKLGKNKRKNYGRVYKPTSSAESQVAPAIAFSNSKPLVVGGRFNFFRRAKIRKWYRWVPDGGQGPR